MIPVSRHAWTRLTWLLLASALTLFSGCSSETGGADDTPSDTDSDSSADDLGGGSDTGPGEGDSSTSPMTCVPGLARCLGLETIEVCGTDERWRAEDCEAGGRCVVTCFEDPGPDGEPGASCQNAICGVPGSCEPGRVDRCLGCGAYEGCHPDGLGEGIWPTGPERSCVEDDDGARLIQPMCEPGSTRCLEGSEVEVEGCVDCGQRWAVIRDCDDERDTNVCDQGQCITQCQFIEKRDTYVGCEYWGLELDQAFVPSGVDFIDGSAAPYAIVVSNVNERVPAQVRVETIEGVVRELVIQPGDLEIIHLNEFIVRGTVQDFLAYKVASDMPIVAYQFNPLNNLEVYSNDASLLFPTSALGTDYYVMTRRQTFDTLKSYLTVTGVLPGETRVTVTLPPATLDNPLITLEGEGIPVLRGGDTFETTLQQFEVLSIETNRIGADLTGARVISDRQVAVFGGSQAANTPNDDSCIYRHPSGTFEGGWVCEADRETPCENASGVPDIEMCKAFITCCADHLEQQMMPTSTLGRRILAARSQPRGDEPDYWRVLAVEDETTVELIGLPDTWHLPRMIPNRRTWTLDAGEWFEVPSPVDFEIEADKPIMVGQFLSAELAPYPGNVPTGPGSRVPYPEPGSYTRAGTGDPAFMLAAPAEQFLDTYVFLTPGGYDTDYVTIVAPIGAGVTLDGTRLSDDDFTPFGRGEYAAGRFQLPVGVHQINADEPVGIMVHGYDRFVSYGYPGGMNLRGLGLVRGDR